MSPVFVLLHSPEQFYHPSLSVKMHVALLPDEILKNARQKNQVYILKFTCLYVAGRNEEEQY